MYGLYFGGIKKKVMTIRPRREPEQHHADGRVCRGLLSQPPSPVATLQTPFQPGRYDNMQIFSNVYIGNFIDSLGPNLFTSALSVLCEFLIDSMILTKGNM